MSSIFSDIVEDVNVKPSKSKLVLKWVVRISVTLISVAFVFGQIKMGHLNRLDDIEKSLQENIKATNELKQEMIDGFDNITIRIDGVYDDGYDAFNDYQEYQKKQLNLIIDYGQTNKDLLKRMLELNTIEKNREVESELKQAKRNNLSIAIKPIKPNKNTKHLIQIISVETQDTIFQAIGATKEFIDNIDDNKYHVDQIVESEKYPELFDVNYSNK